MCILANFKPVIRYLLLLFALLPLTASAQRADSLLHHTAGKPARKKPEYFAQIGYMSEQWVLSANLPNGFSGASYGGKGLFLGGGVMTPANEDKPLSFGIAADYVNYSLSKSLKTEENVPTTYNFLRFTPGAYLTFRTKGKVGFQACASAGLLLPLQTRENSYYQFGLKGILNYKAYGLMLGYNFTHETGTPSTEIVTGKWSEHSVILGVLCYPKRIKFN